MNKELIEQAIHEDTQEFWEYIRNGELRIPKCQQCGKFFFPYGYLCPHCGSTESSWELVSGKGEVFTYTILYRAYNKAFEDKVPYNVSVIALDEGVHVLSNVKCSNDEIHIGMRVRAVLDDVGDGYKLLQFVPEGA